MQTAIFGSIAPKAAAIRTATGGTGRSSSTATDPSMMSSPISSMARKLRGMVAASAVAAYHVSAAAEYPAMPSGPAAERQSDVSTVVTIR